MISKVAATSIGLSVLSGLKSLPHAHHKSTIDCDLDTKNSVGFLHFHHSLDCQSITETKSPDRYPEGTIGGFCLDGSSCNRYSRNRQDTASDLSGSNALKQCVQSRDNHRHHPPRSA